MFSKVEYKLYLQNAPKWATKIKEGDTRYSLDKARQISPIFANLIELQLQEEDIKKKYVEMYEQGKLSAIKEIKELIQLNTELVNLTTKLNVLAESYFSSKVQDKGIEEEIKRYMVAISYINNYIDNRVWLIENSFKGDD